MKVIKFIQMNSPFFGLLVSVWAYLLGLMMVIGVLIVPIDKTQHTAIVNFIIDAGKLLVSLTLIAFWLISWYKVLGYLFYYELNKTSNSNEKINNDPQ